MPDVATNPLLDVLLDSWDRSNTILVNLLRVVPAGGMEVKATQSGPSVAQLFTHAHYVRLVFVQEDAPDVAAAVPEEEWAEESDRDRIVGMLHASAAVVREAVRSSVVSGREMETHFDHPILLLQHLLWHEAYHHGQIKLALKLAGMAIPDDVAGRGSWHVWMDKRNKVS